ncbi:MAG: hypothetical protein KME12_03460 [Trichocoleus desertorum ATA4-8-CV12]|jgi:hypothetical protein|nr:hypothetical protein [Trichocoleus desertorum ATA4-8-CV12]
MTDELETPISKIEKRCKAANIETERNKVVITAARTFKSELVVLLPVGREKTRILIRNNQMAELFLSIPFEDISGVGGYQALCSCKDGYIEALLEFNHLQYLTWGSVYKQLQVALQKELEKEPEISNEDLSFDSDIDDSRIEVLSDEDRFSGIKVSLGWATETFRVLETLRRPSILLSKEGIRLVKPITIRIEGATIKTNEQAINILEKIGNSLLFQLDLLVDILMYLAIEGGRRKSRRSIPSIERSCSLAFPKYQYDSNPMALYWYASMATDMPLLQYLAYYQVLEFYFPIFSDRSAHEIIKRTLKDPLFYSSQDVNISRLISSIKPLVNKGYGSERPALIATLEACLTEHELRSFFKNDPKRLDFFNSKQSKQKTAAFKKISIDNDNVDIINEAAERIYEIRCRIVHAKSSEAGEQSEAILPFSKESQNLEYDIDLIKFIARKVLVGSSHPLVL